MSTQRNFWWKFGSDTPAHFTGADIREIRMPFTIDFLDDGRVLEWTVTDDGVTATEITEDTPRFYVGARGADIDVDGEYLKPHGGRRGLGHELYGEQAELAQEMLRHENIGTTHESYREVRAAERKEQAEEVLFGENSRE